MSGGHFDYNQYRIEDIITEIKELIKNNEYNFSDNTIVKFKEGIDILTMSQIYTQRIDWLVSGDDSEESFHERLKEDLLEMIPKESLTLKNKRFEIIDEDGRQYVRYNVDIDYSFQDDFNTLKIFIKENAK